MQKNYSPMLLLHPLLLLLLPQVMQSMLVKERAAASQPDGTEAAAAAAAHEQQILGLVGQLVNEFEQLQKIGHTMFRLGLIEHLVAGPTSAEWGKKLAALQVGDAAFPGANVAWFAVFWCVVGQAAGCRRSGTQCSGWGSLGIWWRG
jgi:hypothetical protein